jgi:predicted methyltransferase
MPTEPSEILFGADGKRRVAGRTSIKSMRRKWRYVGFIHLIGALATEIILNYGAYENGGFQREHTARDLTVITAIYLGTAALWPALIVVLALMYFGALPRIWDVM